MDCQHCNKQFSSKSNLVKHQQTAKYCIKLQQEVKPEEFPCIGCDKTLCSKFRLQTHQEKCEKYKDIDKIRQLETMLDQANTMLQTKDSTIEKLERHIESLEDRLMKIAMKSTKTTNNITTNIQQNFTPITDERLAEDANNLTIEHLVGGGESIANIFLNGSLKNNALCTDVSRRVLHLKDGDGNIIKDVNVLYTTKRAFSSIVNKAREIKNKCGEVIDTDDDYQIERLGRVMSVVGEIGQTIGGKSTEVGSDFAKAVCLGSVS